MEKLVVVCDECGAEDVPTEVSDASLGHLPDALPLGWLRVYSLHNLYANPTGARDFCTLACLSAYAQQYAPTAAEARR